MKASQGLVSMLCMVDMQEIFPTYQHGYLERIPWIIITNNGKSLIPFKAKYLKHSLTHPFHKLNYGMGVAFSETVRT